MPEAISTQNLVTLPVTSQELGRGGGFLPPNQNRTIKYPNHYRVNDIQFDEKQKISRQCSFYCFNCDTGNDGNHNLFLLIVGRSNRNNRAI